MFEGDEALKRLPITDGLRALAVIAVVLFHVWPAQVRGGYIGVDVFFVISGFVIALRYLPRLSRREIGFADFFLRRIQRLVPAYFVLIVATTIASWFLLKPMDLKNYGDSLASQAVYLQNVVFWLQGDYFENALHKPLLHTWSLAVEEQFYLFFPILVLIFRRRISWGLATLGLAFIGSIALGYVVAHVSPKTAFYLLPMRVWEFAAGIGAAQLFGRVNARAATLPLFLLSLAALVYAPFGFDEATPFPGLQSLLVVLATSLICVIQREVSPASAWVLTNRVAQHFGRISYSWYLWHWPLISLLFLAVERAATPVERAGLLVAGYALAVASYRFVEKPAQARQGLRHARAGLTLLGSFLATALVCGLFLMVSRGGLMRYPPQRANLYAATMDRVPNRCSFMARISMYRAQVCRLVEGKGEAVLLLGDSHADFMKYELSKLAEAAGASLYLTKQDCRPMDYEVDYNCSAAVWAQVAADVRRLKIGKIILIGRWERTIPAETYLSGFERMATTGAHLYIQKVVPNGPFFNPAIRAAGVDPGVPATAADYAKDFAAENAAFAAFAARHPGQVDIVDPVPVLCPGGGACAAATGDEPNYIDDDHMSTVGRARVAPLYRAAFGLKPAS